MTVTPTSAASKERSPSAGGPPIEAGRARLDEALMALREVKDPLVPVRRAEEHLAQALRSIYQALVGRTDFHAYRAGVDAAVEATRRTLGDLQESPSADPVVERLLGLVAAALGALVSAGTLPASLQVDLPDGETPPVTAPAFIPATIGVPAMVSPPRQVLLPAVALPEPPPPPPPPAVEVPPPPPIPDAEALAALAASAEARLGAFDAAADEEEAAGEEEDEQEKQPPPPPVDVLDPPLEERELLWGYARSFLDDIAGFGNMRRPLDFQPWAAPRTEQRLLARVDAIVACGDEVLPRLVKELEDRPVPDPELTWALVFLFGSLTGDDAVDQVIRVVLTADLESPDVALFVADALALAPSPALERPLRAWMDPARPPALRAVALTALGRRRRLGFGETAAATDDGDARVVLAAARALGLSSGAVDATVIDRLLRHADPQVVRAALVSSLQLRCRIGVERARAATAAGKGAVGDAVLFLGVAGEPDAWELLEAAARAGSPPALEALGWFGSFRAVPVLLDVLAKKDDALAGPAAAALQRLTGAGLADDSKPADEPVAEIRQLGGPFEVPMRVAELTKKAEIWSAWWEPRRRQADPNRRHRFGHLWSPEDNLWELEDEQSGAQDRLLAYVELCARTGADVPLDLEDFVVRQKERLKDLRAHASRFGARAGDWPVRLSR